MAKKNKAPLHIQVAEKLIEQLKAGTAPWQKPWSVDSLPEFELPYNTISGKRYRGINVFSLLNAGYEDPRWVTFKQAADNGWQVRRGEKASLVQFIKTNGLVPKKDEQGKPVLDEKGKPVKVRVRFDRPIISTAWVFNARQVDGMRERKVPKLSELAWDPLERAESLISATKADITHKAGDRAYYNSRLDHIVMPEKAQFGSPDKYYATILHELDHWTGHTSRLDRKLGNGFGTEEYAREELRAEIASMIIGQELRIGHDPGQNAAYVDSWVSILEKTPFEIHAASADAERIFNYLITFEQKRAVSVKAANEAERASAAGKSELVMGDEIPYNDTIYRVQGRLKQGRLRIEDIQSGNTFALSLKDGLYRSLVAAKTEAMERGGDLSYGPDERAAYGLRR